MKPESIQAPKGTLFPALVTLLLLIPFAHAQTFSVVYNFTGGSDGADSTAGLTVVSGQFYGTTSEGGTHGYGVVFRISPTGKESAIYNFTGGADGATPESGLLYNAGSLYGTTSAGGASKSGTVFSITPLGKETVLYSFTGGVDGSGPQSGLVKDSMGNLYGTTFSGGASGNGTVFELIRPKTQGGHWIERVLYSFGAGTDGANPVAGVTLDNSGNVYGTTSAGGTYGYGTVFELEKSGAVWAENILYEFQLQSDGGVPYTSVVFDASGNLYGTTTDGGAGGEDGGGTIFEMTPSSAGWTFHVLYGLPGWGISGSFRNILMKAGKIYATTHCDGSYSAGTVYELSPSGSTWTYTELYTFTGGTDGQYSVSNLVFDQLGNLWGTTRYGGAHNWGVVFKVKP